VRTSTPSEPYHPPKRNPLDPWWDRCVPCREMQGAPYVPKPKSKKAAPGGQVNTTEESDAA